MGVYGQSKLSNILFTKELVARTAGSGLTSYAVHPGGVRSDFGRDDLKGIMGIGLMVARPFEISPATGAQASLHCATTPGLESSNGGYFQKRLFGNFGPVTEVQPTAAGRDAKAATALWDRSAELVGL